MFGRMTPKTIGLPPHHLSALERMAEEKTNADPYRWRRHTWADVLREAVRVYVEAAPSTKRSTAARKANATRRIRKGVRRAK